MTNDEERAAQVIAGTACEHREEFVRAIERAALWHGSCVRKDFPVLFQETVNFLGQVKEPLGQLRRFADRLLNRFPGLAAPWPWLFQEFGRVQHLSGP